MAATALMLSVMAVMNLATLHRTAQTRFLPQEHHATKIYLVQGINTPTPKGIDHTPPTMVPDMGDILAGHSPAIVPTTTEAAFSEGIPHTPHLFTTAAYATLWPMDAPTALITSPTDVTHATPHHSWSHFSNSHHATQETTEKN